MIFLKGIGDCGCPLDPAWFENGVDIALDMDVDVDFGYARIGPVGIYAIAPGGETSLQVASYTPSACTPVYSPYDYEQTSPIPCRCAERPVMRVDFTVPKEYIWPCSGGIVLAGTYSNICDDPGGYPVYPPLILIDTQRAPFLGSFQFQNHTGYGGYNFSVGFASDPLTAPRHTIAIGGYGDPRYYAWGGSLP